MNIKEKFLNLLHTKTADGFHDAVLSEIKFIFEKKEIIISIYHWKKEKDNEGFFKGNIIFYNAGNISLENNSNFFLYDDEISMLNIAENDINNFRLIGKEGWVLSFSSLDFTYEEKFIGEEY